MKIDRSPPRQIRTSVTSGGVGHVFGTYPVWGMSDRFLGCLFRSAGFARSVFGAAAVAGDYSRGADIFRHNRFPLFGFSASRRPPAVSGCSTGWVHHGKRTSAGFVVTNAKGCPSVDGQPFTCGRLTGAPFVYIMPMPFMPGAPAGIGGRGSFFSASTHSVVRNMEAIEAAFSSATRATLVGSRMPASSMSS